MSYEARRSLALLTDNAKLIIEKPISQIMNNCKDFSEGPSITLQGDCTY